MALDQSLAHLSLSSKESNNIDTYYQPFTILQVNVQCMRNKITELEQVCDSKKVDAVCVSEHWLAKQEIELYVPQEYLPASFFCRSSKKNGGVGIFLKRGITFVPIDFSEFNEELDFEICGINLSEHNVIIVSIYRSPQGNINNFLEKFELAMKTKVLKKGISVVICGDFNIEFLSIQSHSSQVFSNLLKSLNLKATVRTPTHFNSCIDNILVNFSEDLFKNFDIDYELADHKLNFLSMFLSKSKVKKTKSEENKVEFRSQNDIFITKFCEHLGQEKWAMLEEFALGDLNVEELFTLFFKKYVDLWHYSSPLVIKKKVKGSHSQKKINWYNSNLAEERKCMLNIFNVYKCMRDRGSQQAPVAYKAYLAAKKAYRINLTKAKRQAYEQYIESSSNRCKAAWQVINLETSSAKAQDVNLNPDLTNSFFLKSALDLAKTFSATANPGNTKFFPDTKNYVQVPRNSFQWKEVKSEDIVRIVSKLSNSKSTDFFWISNYIVKKTIFSIKDPLAFVINKCLESGYFPDLLKVSKVIPIYKKGDKHLPQSYRPVSIVPIFSKILEMVMHKQLSLHFENFNLLSDSQFGFRQGRSTTSAVLEVINHTLEAFERRETVALSLLDLSKAFDCVPFDSILNKLQAYGVSDRACKIISSYLSGRKQYVSCKGANSSMLEVTLGVPQGSVLGPFFFTIIINDLPQHLNVKSVIYADDTSIFASHRNVDVLQENIKSAQTDAQNWFTFNKLNCNPEKTQNILLSLANVTQAQPVKLLGFYIDQKLSWNEHINSVCGKISRVSYLLWKLKDLVSVEHLRSCYFAFFQSHIAYGLIIWGHSAAVSNILLIQKKVIRNLCGARYLESCRPLFIQTKILTVINLYIYHILIYTKTNLHLFLTRQDFHQHFTRFRYKLDLPQHRLTKTGSAHQANCINFFNKLESGAFTTKFPNFKNKLLTWLQMHPFYSIDEFLASNVNIDLNF